MMARYRRQCVRQYVQIGCPQVVIVVMRMAMMIIVIVFMVWRRNQDPGAYTVHGQTESGNDYGLVKRNYDRVDQAVGTLGHHDDCKAQ